MSDNHTNISKQEPELYKATVALSQQAEAAALDAGLSAALLELVKIRVSQLNGCTFCMRMHTEDAVTQGVPLAKVAVLPAWRETGYFDARAEALEPTTALDSVQAAAVAWVAIVMNAFNRIAIISHYDVAPA